MVRPPGKQTAQSAAEGAGADVVEKGALGEERWAQGSEDLRNVVAVAGPLLGLREDPQVHDRRR